ncbi:MICAL-like protein 2 isoform X2 [Emydura macquarii macquarii]|uniref:MICAL-like protein 2 isoform X2 n=1 Tax=Emydura macquarii macquarii TaxID=1129001 RepID=UPI00352A1B57
MAAIKNLQLWCKQQCEGYRDVSITNMTTSFRDGLAFCAILHRHRPELINFNILSKENVYENNNLAFRVAEEQLGIPALLDAEDMVALKVPDRLSILTYVSQYYNYFHGRSPIGGMSGIKRSTSESSEEPPGKKVISEPVKPIPVKPSPARLPPVVKTNPAHVGQDLPKENPPVTTKRVLTDSGNLRSNNCAICGSHVHLVQRHLVDGKLYHRNCFRCKQCSNTLLSGAYKAGTETGTYICTSHQQPASLWNSGPRSTENKPASTSTTSGDPQKVSVKPSQLNKDTSYPFSHPSSARPSGSSAGSNSSSGSKCLNAGNKSDHREGTTSPLSWTPSGAKTQQAREKFFQSNAGPSGSSADKSPATKDQVLPSHPSQPAGKTTYGRRFFETNSGGTEKDQARQHLMQALPGSNPSPNRPAGVSSGGSLLPSSFSPTISHEQSPDNKIQANKPGYAAQSPVTNVKHFPKTPGNKLGVGAATQNGEKGQTVSRLANTGRKNDWKDTRGRVNIAEDKSENPADWLSRLKPVANKDSNQGGPRKPMDSSKGISSPAQEKEKSASPIASPANKDTASSAALPQKKKLVPSKDLCSDLQKWGESPAKKEESGQSNRVSAPVKPLTPKIFQSLEDGDLASLSKLQTDYIPEEEIQEKVREIEKQLDELELKGVDMEQHLRDCEGDDSEDALMVDWFKLIHEKQLLLRLESELMYKSKQQKLEEKQWNIESELRRLMNKPEEQKTSTEKRREKELLDSYLDTVNDRNNIVECLDEDRLRELEEDQMLADMLRKLDGPHESQEPNKRKNKFRWSKIWKQKSKKKAEQ